MQVGRSRRQVHSQKKIIWVGTVGRYLHFIHTTFRLSFFQYFIYTLFIFTLISATLKKAQVLVGTVGRQVGRQVLKTRQNFGHVRLRLGRNARYRQVGHDFRPATIDFYFLVEVGTYGTYILHTSLNQHHTEPTMERESVARVYALSLDPCISYPIRRWCRPTYFSQLVQQATLIYGWAGRD